MRDGRGGGLVDQHAVAKPFEGEGALIGCGSSFAIV